MTNSVGLWPSALSSTGRPRAGRHSVLFSAPFNPGQCSSSATKWSHQEFAWTVSSRKLVIDHHSASSLQTVAGLLWPCPLVASIYSMLRGPSPGIVWSGRRDHCQSDLQYKMAFSLSSFDDRSLSFRAIPSKETCLDVLAASIVAFHVSE